MCASFCINCGFLSQSSIFTSRHIYSRITSVMSVLLGLTMFMWYIYFMPSGSLVGNNCTRSYLVFCLPFSSSYLILKVVQMSAKISINRFQLFSLRFLVYVCSNGSILFSSICIIDIFQVSNKLVIPRVQGSISLSHISLISPEAFTCFL